MTLFENPVLPQQSEKLESMWQGLHLQDPWSVGKLSNIFELRAFDQRQDWVEFYYRMGEMRVKELSRLTHDEVEVLENDLLASYDAEIIENLSWQLKNINYQNGRTKEQLQKKADTLHKYAMKNGVECTFQQCFEVIQYAVMGVTWNEAAIRAENTVSTLKKRFPFITFDKKDGKFDRKYAVDYELYKKQRLVCGIQIKPASYFRSFSPYIKRAKAIAAIKNQDYRQQHGSSVFDVISDTEGTILNHTIFESIEGQLQS